MFDLIGSATLGLVAVVVFLTVAEWTLRSQLRAASKVDAGEPFVFTMRYRAGCVGFFVFILFTNYLLLVHYARPGLTWDLLGFAWLATSLPLGWYLLRNAFVFRLWIDEDHLRAQTLSGTRVMAWGDLERVRWIESRWAFRVEGGGQAVHISVFVDGLAGLMDMLRQRAPGVDVLAAQQKLDELRG